MSLKKGFNPQTNVKDAEKKLRRRIIARIEELPGRALIKAANFIDVKIPKLLLKDSKKDVTSSH